MKNDKETSTENSAAVLNNSINRILGFKDYFQNSLEGDSENPSLINQLLIGLILREFASLIDAPNLKEKCSVVAKQLISSNSDRLVRGKGGDTPLNDFIADLANPQLLARYRANPLEVLAGAGLSDTQQQLLSSNERGLLRVRLLQELERTGYAPLVSNNLV